MDACSPVWSWPQLPAHQEWLCWCREAGCCHPGTPTRLQQCHGLCYRPLHTAFAAHAPPTSALNPSGHLLHRRPASVVDCLRCETNGNHFTEECRNMQRSNEQSKANRSQPKTSASKGKPRLQMQRLQSLLMKQVASILPQTSSRITPGTQTQGQRAI